MNTYLHLSMKDIFQPFFFFLRLKHKPVFVLFLSAIVIKTLAPDVASVREISLILQELDMRPKPLGIFILWCLPMLPK